MEFGAMNFNQSLKHLAWRGWAGLFPGGVLIMNIKQRFEFGDLQCPLMCSRTAFTVVGC